EVRRVIRQRRRFGRAWDRAKEQLAGESLRRSGTHRLVGLDADDRVPAPHEELCRYPGARPDVDDPRRARTDTELPFDHGNHFVRIPRSIAYVVVDAVGEALGGLPRCVAHSIV